VTDVAQRQLAELLREAGNAHHDAFAAADGADAEWPTWYAEYLAPRLRDVLGRSVSSIELAERLREWHGEHERSRSAEPWPDFYARSLLTLRNPGN